MNLNIEINGEGLEDLSRVQSEVMMYSVLGCVQDEVNCGLGLSGYIELPKTKYQGSKPVALEISYKFIK